MHPKICKKLRINELGEKKGGKKMVNTRSTVKRVEVVTAAVNDDQQQQILSLTDPNYSLNHNDEVKTCSSPASTRCPFGYIKRYHCSHDVKKETQYGVLADNSHLQLQNVDEQIDYIQALYPSGSQPEPTDKKSFFIEANPVLDKPQSPGQAPSNATSLNLSDMLALDDEFSSADSKKIEALVTVAGYRVKPEVGPTLRGILAKYGDIAANCKKSTEFRSLLLENVCEIVRKLEATEFVCLTTVEIESFRLLLKDMELDVNVGWLLQRLDELNGAKKLLRESPIVKQGKRQKESEIIVYEIEIQRLQEKIKCAQNAMELKKEEKRKFDKVLSDTKVKLKKYHCGSMTDGLI